MTTPNMPVIDEPGAIGGTLPRVADMRNRAVLIQPLKIDRNVPGVQPGTTQDRITANVFVLDGGPLEFGGKPEKFVPHTMVTACPSLHEGVYISQTNMVKALLGSLPSTQRPQGGICMGRIVQGQASKAEHNPPWNLAEVPAADPARGIAQQVLQAWITGAFVNPEPQPTGTAAPAAPGAPTYPVTHAVAGMGQHGASVIPATGAPMATPSNPQSVQSVTAPGAVDPAFLAWQKAQQAPPPPAAAPAPGSYEAYLASQQQAATAGPSAIPAAPTGWPQSAWEALTSEQRAGILGQVAAQPAATTGF